MARVVIIAVWFLGICSVSFADESTKAKLDSCILYYQDGEYQKTVDSLKALLPLISNRQEEIEAYKYLGFSYVMLDMISKAKEFFRVALEKFPAMVIDTLEVPPNITIVFKQTQLETKMAKGDILDKDVQRRNEKRVITATVIAATGTVAAGVGGYFCYRGYRSRDHYFNVNAEDPDRQEQLDYWGEKFQRELLIGGVTAGTGVIELGLATWLFFRKPAPKKISAFYEDGVFGVVWRF
ncbi:MAG: hypothetical protein JW768_07960 [Chitinispirillaceae bacterium]|nr:hypothetical protein [Chitinispirillaceae bacterium]